MFYCQVTNKLSNPGEKCLKLVVRTRPKTYFTWVKNEDTREWSKVESGRGWEIVQELNVSEEGKTEWETMDESARAQFVNALNSPNN